MSINDNSLNRCPLPSLSKRNTIWEINLLLHKKNECKNGACNVSKQFPKQKPAKIHLTWEHLFLDIWIGNVIFLLFENSLIFLKFLYFILEIFACGMINRNFKNHILKILPNFLLKVFVFDLEISAVKTSGICYGLINF